MTDEKKPDSSEEVDWEKALSEWDSQSFSPEVAKDKSTDKPATPLSGSSASRPLYRPPTAPNLPVTPPTMSKSPAPPPRPATSGIPRPPPRPAPAISRAPTPIATRSPSPPPPPPPPAAQAPSPPPPPPPPPPMDDDVEEEEGATVIAAIPRDLLTRSGDEGPKSSSRGGLGQLFAREEKREAIDVSFEESQARVPTAAAALPVRETPSDVFTSALPVKPSRPDAAEAMPPRRASHAEPDAHVPEGAMFDPFADPAPRSAQATRPAEDEIDDLLAHPPPSSSGLGPDVPVALPAAGQPPPDRGPALLAPDARQYDPNEETMVGRDADLARAREAIAAKRAAAQPIPPPASRTWEDERPASAWLDEGARTRLAATAEWLEVEARAKADKVARARGLLGCSELQAVVGERERAQALAIEARDLAPSLALAHKQARALMPSPPDPDDLHEALDVETRMTPAGPARLHAMLLAAEALRAAGDDEGAAKRVDQAARQAPTDARAVVMRAVRALARNDVASPALRPTDGGDELAPIVQALDTALRLRGVERKDATGGEPTANELLLRVRGALDKGDVAAAAPLVAQLADIPELAGGATWLALSLATARAARRPDAIRWLNELVEKGDPLARPVLLSRAIEVDDRDALTAAATGPGPFTTAERTVFAALAGLPLSPTDALLDATSATPGMAPLAAAVGALSVVVPGDDRSAQVVARAARTAGAPEASAQVRLGRLLGAAAAPADVEATLAALGESGSGAVRALSLEMAVRSGRVAEVSRALESWGGPGRTAEERAVAAIAAGMVAERSGDRARALEAFRVARAADPTNEAALRAIASIEQIDLVAEMNALADELGDGPRAAVARVEAVARGEGALPEPTRAELLERAHRAAPGLPVPSFLAERIARRTGDVEEVLRIVRERRTNSVDVIEAALDGVREALLLADKDPAVAAERLLEAHRARPGDVGLRELYERMAFEPPDDRGAWRERRAAESTGDARTLLFLEAAHEYELAGDATGALRAAEASAASDSPLGRIARERAELATANVARLADELLTAAKSTEDPNVRREAYERLAVLDAEARQDAGSALLWHRSILEEQPGYLPSLRHVEQQLVGEGRDEEMEPIASAAAHALKGVDPGEASAHAELAARLRLRGVEGSWEGTREMAELAAGETPASLWSLRMLEAHSRSRGDDEALAAATLRLVERSQRPAETAALLVRAGDAASRLGRLDDARALLERGAAEDPGDVVAWGLLADVRQRAGDGKGAAEACEALARSSGVREHQLLAWYDAGRIWQDEGRDDERAMVALEAAAAIDPSYEDLFDRLSRLYATRKMQPELAALLERRLEAISDPGERLAMEVRRGRILLEVGDTDGARAAFEAALAQQPDDSGALSAFADLCVAQKDWEGAEQALVRLARLLPTPEEQRDVYSRLGDLYAEHLVNLSRAEVALKEVLKRAPDDPATLQRLVEVYKRQNDPARALELQQQLVAKAASPEEKRARVIALSAIYEQTSHDNRKAEQTLETARREFPQDVSLLRALAEFYGRHNQTPAVNILLDRAGADARRGLAAGRFSAPLFEVLAAVFELRGKKDAARVSQAMLAALEGRPADLNGGAQRAFDPRLDDLLAPDVLSPALRTLLAKTGDALDGAVPYDVRGQKATALPADSPIARIVATAAHALGTGPVQVLVSPKLGATCLPCGSNPPTIVVGEALAQHERVAGFLILRALKLVLAHASALARTPAAELPVLVSAWLKCFNPTWQPQGVNAAMVNAMGGRIQSAMPRGLGPDVAVVALEVAGNLGTQAATLGNNALYWGNRVTLLALGDPTSLLDSLAVAGGLHQGAPREAKDRTTWIARAAEARDVVSFGVTDAFAEARARIGLDR